MTFKFDLNAKLEYVSYTTNGYIVNYSVILSNFENVSVSLPTDVVHTHSGGAATCSLKAVCEVCGLSYGKLDSTNHNIETIEAKAATCGVDGNIAYYYCKDCNKCFSDSEAISEIELSSVTIARTSHSYSDDGFCTNCKMHKSSESINYTLSSDCTYYTVSGFKSSYSESTLYIPSSYNGIPVTSIASKAFYNNTNITSVTIPENVTSIGNRAFSYCASLSSITIPSNVTSIGSQVFFGCYKLVEVYNLSSSITITAGSKDNGYIGYYALDVYTSTDSTSKLTTTDDGYIFYEDGDTVYLIGYTGSSTILTLPDKYNNKNYSIYKYAFAYNTNITSITIPDSVTSIGNSAFDYCTSLTSVTIGSGVTSIESYAFYYCTSLTSLKIEEGVKNIGRYAFYGCTSLTKVYYKGTSTNWSSISIGSNNSYLTSATIYYYSSTNPFSDTVTEGNYWYYDTDGNIAIWENTSSSTEE